MPSSERSENRRMNKPIMEKRRRARINDSLNDLKNLVLEGLKKDPARHSKLEKADILEMAVRHLRSLHSRAGLHANRFQEGYADCAKEVASYLNGQQEMDLEVKQRLMVHLASSYRPAVTAGGSAPSPAPAAAPAPAATALLGSLQLVPTLLPGGELGYVIQTGQPGVVLAPPRPAGPPAPLSACFEPAAASVGSPSPVPSSQAEPEPGWDPAAPSSPSSSVGSFGSCEGRADSPRPLDLVAHNRGSDEEAHWRPW